MNADTKQTTRTPLYCGKYGCDNGVVWMMSEFPVPCDDCRRLREKAAKERQEQSA